MHVSTCLINEEETSRRLKCKAKLSHKILIYSFHVRHNSPCQLIFNLFAYYKNEFQVNNVAP